jgi:hypothetical protein
MQLPDKLWARLSDHAPLTAEIKLQAGKAFWRSSLF